MQLHANYKKFSINPKLYILRVKGCEKKFHGNSNQDDKTGHANIRWNSSHLKRLQETKKVVYIIQKFQYINIAIKYLRI